MNRRDVHVNGPRGYPSKEISNISLSPSRFQPKSSPSSRRRRQLILRLLLGASATSLLFLLFMPSLRAVIINTVSLGLVTAPPELQLETVRYYDLSNSGGTARGWEREERVLMCAPLRDAESHLPMFFSHLHNFTYPHHLVDLAFLVSDSRDNTLSLLSQMLTDLQNDPDPKQPYGEISVIEKDFGQKVNQDVESRHGFAAQASRRKLMAQARNWLLSAALRPTHSWVYWRDVDVETAPFTILEDLMRHNKDVIVPNVWRPLPDWLGGEQPYDLNSWQESETALALADTLDEDAVIVEGYAEYATWRPHLAYLRDPYGDPDMEMEIDGVGGVSILAKAKVFRSGVHFPAFSFEKHAETEGFGKMAKRMQFSVVGLPHYTVWHLYEPSVDDIRHMEEMEQERRNRETEERERAERAKKIKEEFGDTGSQWDKDKSGMTDISQKDERIRKEHEGAMAAQDKEKTSESSKKDKATDGKIVETQRETDADSLPQKAAKAEKGAKESENIADEDDSKDTKGTASNRAPKNAKGVADLPEAVEAKDAKIAASDDEGEDSNNRKKSKSGQQAKKPPKFRDSEDVEESAGSTKDRSKEVGSKKAPKEKPLIEGELKESSGKEDPESKPRKGSKEETVAKEP